ncbi:hypothetical protein BG011_003515, partial [Mortierella polycephala]
MSRINSPTPRYTILVTIVEGRYFVRDPDCQLLVQCQFNDALFIDNPETNSHSYPEVLSTDPTNEEESLGHIILDLNSAFEPESAEEHWEALTGSNTAGFKGLQPQLKIAFSIDDGVSEVAPTIDTLLTSIESSSGSEEVEHTDQRYSRFGKANVGGVLQGLEEEDEHENDHRFDDEDQDRQVPSAGDRSFYHARDSQGSDAEVPEFDMDEAMQMDIPVDIGEALIPTEVNDKRFLQLGLGRDYFIFTITIQTTRNLERL